MSASLLTCLLMALTASTVHGGGLGCVSCGAPKTVHRELTIFVTYTDPTVTGPDGKKLPSTHYLNTNKHCLLPLLIGGACDKNAKTKQRVVSISFDDDPTTTFSYTVTFKLFRPAQALQALAKESCLRSVMFLYNVAHDDSFDRLNMLIREFNNKLKQNHYETNPLFLPVSLTGSTDVVTEKMRTLQRVLYERQLPVRIPVPFAATLNINQEERKVQRIQNDPMLEIVRYIHQVGDAVCKIGPMSGCCAF
eukprot:GILK01002088.1.p1 GENE.GILK01002088.1~~GILK01002088.1.p1  ORF type:complete len:250 (-),score=22.59 GILK01002088.1:190-939(-)